MISKYILNIPGTNTLPDMRSKRSRGHPLLARASAQSSPFW